MFDGAELRRFVDAASWVAVNDYEAQMLCERTGRSIEALSRSHLRGMIVTLGAQGCEVWQQGVKTTVPGVAATEVVDPTGCGDAFRARCSTASREAGRSPIAPAWATASARSRSPAAAARIMCWIARLPVPEGPPAQVHRSPSEVAVWTFVKVAR